MSQNRGCSCGGEIVRRPYQRHYECTNCGENLDMTTPRPSKTAERIAAHLISCADRSFSALNNVGHVIIDFNRTADMQVYNEVVELIGESYEGEMRISVFMVRVIIQRKAGL